MTNGSLQVENEQPQSGDSRYQTTRLSPKFTFDRYVEGRANRVAIASAEDIAKSIDTKYRLLYIHGEIGVGKTHMLQAIGNAFFSSNPGAAIRCAHSEDFFMDVIDAFKRNTWDDFKRYYRSLDLLIIDDIEFWEAKKRAQEEFYHVINALARANKTVVISSSKCPSDLVGIDQQLVSRFEGGVVIAIEPPNRRLRKSILKRLATQNELDLSNGVMRFITRRLKSNVRQLEGAVHSLVTHSKCPRQSITLPFAKAALADPSSHV